MAYLLIATKNVANLAVYSFCHVNIAHKTFHLLEIV